jgi:hypothetical protein
MLALAGMLALCSATARAQDDATPPLPGSEEANEAKSRAAAVLNEGNQLFEQKKFAPALAKYESAYRIYPSPKILYNIAEAHRELSHYGEAATYYERFLKEANVDPSSPVYAKVNERLQSLKSNLAYIAVQSSVSGAEVRIDGRSVGRTPLEPVAVAPGTHEVSATAAGRQPFRTSVDASAGKSVSVPLALAMAESPKGSSKAAAAPPPPPPPKTEVASNAEASQEEGGGQDGSSAQVADSPFSTETQAPQKEDESITSQPWFWGILAGVVVVAGVITVVAVTSHGNDYVPMGELGSTSTSQWMKF